MDFNEIGEKHWAAISSVERFTLLNDLAAEIGKHDFKPGWIDETFVVAQIPSFDDVPSEIRGRLMLAMTDAGFDLQEYRRVVRKIVSFRDSS